MTMAMRNNPGFNTDLTEEERELILHPATIEAMKTYVCEHPGLDDNGMNSLKLSKGRDDRNKSNFGNGQKLAFELTSTKHQEREAADNVERERKKKEKEKKFPLV